MVLDKMEEVDDSDYINANYIHGYQKPKAYIAAQGFILKLSKSVELSLTKLVAQIILMFVTVYVCGVGCNKYTVQDVWRLVWQVDCRRIIMVTNLVEDGKVMALLYDFYLNLVGD